LKDKIEFLNNSKSDFGVIFFVQFNFIQIPNKNFGYFDYIFNVYLRIFWVNSK